MLSEFRSTNITWDKAASRIYTPVTANTSDENGRKLVVKIVNGGQVADLTGATLHLYWITIDKSHDGLDIFKSVDLKKGEFELSYTTGMLSNKGVLNANLVLIDTVGRVVSERFKITVKEGIDDDAIQSENSFSSLTQALIEVGPRLDLLTSQLQQTNVLSAEAVAKADAMASGSPKGVYATLTLLQAAYPTGTTGTYLVTADGNWYYWSDSAWISGGVYQSAGIADGSISEEKLDFDVKEKLTEEWLDDTVAYAIVDKNGRSALSIDKDGVTTLFKVSKESEIDELSLTGVVEVDDYASGLSYGIIDENDRLSEIQLDANGQIPLYVLEQWKSRVSEDVTTILPNISCWGDSLTGGAGGLKGTQLWVGKLGQMIPDRQIINMGVGGEKSNDIASRQGGLAMLVNNIIIPADTTKIEIANPAARLFDDRGNPVEPFKQQQPNINPCWIAGVQGTLSITDASSYESRKWWFQRATVGTEVVINRPTPVITNGSILRKNDIMIIFIGANGGYSSNADLIGQIKAMVDFNGANPTEYIVVGLTTGTTSSRAALVADQRQAFGRRFIDLGGYLAQYGMADAGLSPTADDLTLMANGSVPQSLRVDSVHFNEACGGVIANLFYNKLKELGLVQGGY